MYETFLGFHSRPFASTACSEHALFGQSMQKALANARQCIDRGAGPAMFIGAPGVGKSSLLAKLGHQYRDQFHIVNMSCSRLDGRQEFLQTVLFELRQPYRGFSEGELRLSLLDFLRSDKEKPNGILLLIDDGENLSVEVLDEIRVVSNFVQDGQPRTRLVLTGGYRLEELLSDPRLQSLNQRIAARCFLRSLTHAESDEFVRDQIHRCGGDGQTLFGDESLQTIYELTEGCPRFVNQLCDHVLILCATYGHRQVDAGMVREAWSDLQCFPDAFPRAPGSSSFCQTTKEMIGDQGKWSIIEFGSLDETSSVEQSRLPAESIPDSGFCSTTSSNLESELRSDFESGPVNVDSKIHSNFESTSDASFESTSDASFESTSDASFESTFGEDRNSSSCQTQVPELGSTEGNSRRRDKQEFQSFTTDVGDGWRFSSQASFNPYESHTEWEQASDPPVLDQPEVHWGTQDLEQSGSALEQPALKPESLYVASNPFAEQFDEVEVVASRFAKQIAECNRAAQDLTPSDLTGLNSIFDTFNSELQSSLAFPSDCCEGREPCSPWVKESIFESDCQSLDQQPGVEQAQRDELSQTSVRFSSPPMPVATDATSARVEQEADALLQQLSNAFGEPIDHFNRPLQVSHENPVADQAYTLRIPSEPTQATAQGGAATPSSLDAEMQELNSLRQAIEEQNRFSAQAFDRLIVQTDAQSVGRAWQSPSQGQADEIPANSPLLHHSDDRKILICQPSDSVLNEPSNHAERLPFPPTPVSTGRAERMDYQQLFNQLRNLPDT